VGVGGGGRGGGVVVFCGGGVGGLGLCWEGGWGLVTLALDQSKRALC